ncbi:MAG: YraN family protein [Desulfobacteraceae bacterium]|nr:YraN family protein [Desulfobacteraceae bacterium]
MPLPFSKLFPFRRKPKAAAGATAGPMPVGRQGEELARRHLERHGYRIIACNYRVRFGEIDLIAEEGETLVFIEVKTRTGPTHGHPLEAVTPAKQRQLARVALEYLSRERGERPVRFDVVAVLLNTSGPPRIEIIRNAFELPAGM